jgi:hypothetical protein
MVEIKTSKRSGYENHWRLGINLSSVISKGLLIDKLRFDGLIMKKHE